MTQRRSVVPTLVAAILGLCALSAPLPVGAAGSPVVAPPTHLRPVQSKADCAAALSLLAVVCGSAVTQGDLQLIWNDPNKNVTGYKVYRVDGGGHQLLGASTARYYLVKKSSEGYANLCFAVEATVGNETSKDSARYCYAPGGTATTRTLKPSHAVAQVAWTSPAGVQCTGNPLPGSAFFKAADQDYGGAFTQFFPWVTNEQPTSGRIGVSGVYAGTEAAVMAINIHQPSAPFGGYFCSVPKNMRAVAEITALSGAAFDLGDLANHKLYSAALTLTSSQTVVFASGKATLSNGGWCVIFIGVANKEWWISPLGNLTFGSAGRMSVASQPKAAIDVTSIVSGWEKYQYRANYGFIVAGSLPPGAQPPVSTACLTKYSTPSLQVVYF